jgi:hypothetical protein
MPADRLCLRPKHEFDYNGTTVAIKDNNKNLDIVQQQDRQ